LLEAVSGKTVARAREVLAECFPRPDVRQTVRKLPERTHTTNAATRVPPPGGGSLLDVRAADALGATGATADARQSIPMNRSSNLPAAASEPMTQAAPLTPPPLPPARAARASALEPLSPGRYKVTFTADAELKRKLDLARVLLGHALPQGNLASIIGRALDMLIEKTERRRFAKSSKPNIKAGKQSERLNRAQPVGSKECPVRNDRDTPPRTTAANCRRRARHWPRPPTAAAERRRGAPPRSAAADRRRRLPPPSAAGRRRDWRRRAPRTAADCRRRAPRTAAATGAAERRGPPPRLAPRSAAADRRRDWRRGAPPSAAAVVFPSCAQSRAVRSIGDGRAPLPIGTARGEHS
jgi:hypothetical protein